MGLKAYAARRILEIVPVVLVVLIFNFLLIHLAPGDPAVIMAGEVATQDQIEALRVQMGLDKPLFDQLVIYVSNVLRGNLGYSLTYQRPVFEIIVERTGATLLLVFSSLFVGIGVGVLAGVYSARKHGSRIERLTSAVSLALYSMPLFWLGLLLILFFAVNLHWFPAAGMASAFQGTSQFANAVDVAWHLVLPTATLGTAWYMPQFLRIARASVIEQMDEPYVRTARALGFKENTVFFKYVLRNAMLPIVTLMAISMGLAFSGALLTESVFSWPGIGRMTFDAVEFRDYPLIMGIFLIVSVTVMAFQVLADIVYAILDPRVAYK